MKLYGIKIKSLCGVNLKSKEPVVPVSDELNIVINRKKSAVRSVSIYNRSSHYYSELNKNKNTVDMEFDIKQLVVKPDFSGLTVRENTTTDNNYTKIKLHSNDSLINRSESVVSMEFDIKQLVVKPDFSGLTRRDKAVMNVQYKIALNNINTVTTERDKAVVNSNIEILEV